MHFLGDQNIDKGNRENVEICFLIEAGASVAEEKPMSADERNNSMMETYLNLVRGFGVDNFVDGQTQEDMCS
jgi:hypothetical protein